MRNVPSVVTSLAILITLFLDAPTVVDADAFVGPQSVSFVPRTVTATAVTSSSLSQKQQLPLLVLERLRGGASSAAAAGAIDVEIESSDDEVEVDDDDEDEEEEVEAADNKLAKAAQEAVSKVKSKASRAATQAAKAAVTSKLRATAVSSTTKKNSSSKKLGWTKFFHTPYIIKACLNPFVFIEMTRAYWVSLFNIQFLDGFKVRGVLVYFFVYQLFRFHSFCM